MTSAGIMTGSEISIDIGGITPSVPYTANASAASTDAVVPVVGNTTAIAVVGGAWTGDYARLQIEGCWEMDGVGATVSEFALIAGSIS
jgi:hypothetical protein